MKPAELFACAKQFKEDTVIGRYVHYPDIENYLQKSDLDYCIAAYSVEKRPIYELRFGTGKIKILMWSQMHGNESTTTKGLVDFLNFVQSEDILAQEILQKFQFVVVPMLNPDGAFYYTRFNANQVDLNRDAYCQTQPEMQYLQQLINAFQPDFCFNLHDQRTIFSAGNSANPATLSLLAPAYNPERELNDTRKKTMQVAVDIAAALSDIIPNQIGRYDDSFNMNCIGDNLTTKNIPVLLIEAGHFPNDYQREQTRLLVFVSIVAGLRSISEKKYDADVVVKYEQIPENQKLFNDVLVKRLKIKGEEIQKIGYQYQEKSEKETVVFVLQKDENSGSKGKYGHIELNFDNHDFASEDELIEEIYSRVKNMNEVYTFVENDKKILK